MGTISWNWGIFPELAGVFDPTGERQALKRENGNVTAAVFNQPTARVDSIAVSPLMAWSLLQPFVVRFKDRVVADQSHVRGHETTMAN